VTDLVHELNRAIEARKLFKPGERVLVAVSGGLDSMVLLRVLHELARRHSWKLIVAHFNHQLRGRSSDADERLVVRTAKTFHLRIVVERADVRGFARAQKVSIEMAARKLRHEFLARVAARFGIRSIALAHHADDQVELFFLRILRGSGGAGLTGMQWRSASPGDAKIKLVRPLLGQSKQALREYARAAEVPFREDASNVRLEFQRNRIRHELLPLLRRKYQPALDRVVLRLMEIVGAEAECIGRLAEEWLAGERRISFADLPRAIQRRCLQLELLELGVTPEFDLVERLRLEPGRKVVIEPGLTVVRTYSGEVGLEKMESGNLAVASDRFELDLHPGSGSLEFAGLAVDWRVLSRSGSALPKPRPGQEHFDADKVGSRLVLRHWEAGDRFQPIGMEAPVKLQDLFTNLKIPRGERHELAVLTTAAGKLIWVEKVRISERFKLCSGTKRRLQWRWKRL
jgi:tRNA(Ile)-lysidine synthase